MWSYYGAKTKIVDFYPPPMHDKIIEPFAGTARYALKYYDRDILLLDKWDVIVKIWLWLQSCSPNDILSLPRFQGGDKIDRTDFDCIEQAWLMGFLIKRGSKTPDLTCSHRGAENLDKNIRRIAADLWKIKHWQIKLGSYEDIPNEQATWFFDPPYMIGGEHYRMSSKHIDYKKLADFVNSRDGQIIVCENERATWMEFKTFRTQNALRGKYAEAIYTNMPSAFDNEQIKLLL